MILFEKELFGWRMMIMWITDGDCCPRLWFGIGGFKFNENLTRQLYSKGAYFYMFFFNRELNFSIEKVTDREDI